MAPMCSSRRVFAGMIGLFVLLVFIPQTWWLAGMHGGGHRGAATAVDFVLLASRTPAHDERFAGLLRQLGAYDPLHFEQQQQGLDNDNDDASLEVLSYSLAAPWKRHLKEVEEWNDRFAAAAAAPPDGRPTDAASSQSPVVDFTSAFAGDLSGPLKKRRDRLRQQLLSASQATGDRPLLIRSSRFPATADRFALNHVCLAVDLTLPRCHRLASGASDSASRHALCQLVPSLPRCRASLPHMHLFRSIDGGPDLSEPLGAGDDPLFPFYDALDRRVPFEQFVARYSGGSAGRPLVAMYVNSGFVSMAANALCIYSQSAMGRSQGQLVVLALDDKVCRALRYFPYPCYFHADIASRSAAALTGKGEHRRRRGKQLEKVQNWSLDPDSLYHQLLVMKMEYVRAVVATGSDLLLLDADVLILGHPLNQIRALPEYSDATAAAGADLFVQSDARRQRPETADWLCAGFMYVKANQRTRWLFDATIRLMERSGAPDQDALQWLLTGHSQWFEIDERDGKEAAAAAATATSNGGSVDRPRHIVLDYDQFANGKLLDQPPSSGLRWKSGRRKPPVLVHVNMRALHKKIIALRAHHAWLLEPHPHHANQSQLACVNRLTSEQIQALNEKNTGS